MNRLKSAIILLHFFLCMLVYLLSAKYLDNVSKVYKTVFGVKDAKPVLKFHGENKFVTFYQEGEGVEVETVLMPCVLK